MAMCEFQELYVSGDKIGVVCTKQRYNPLRITCELVCKKCDLGENFPLIAVDAIHDDDVQELATGVEDLDAN